MTGIYQITNLINGKRYVGLAVNIRRRFIEHKTPTALKKTSVLAKAFRKYGVENFTFEVLEECDRTELAAREVFWIGQLRPEYNMTAGGDGNVGREVSEATRAKLAAAGRVQWERLSDDQKAARVSNNLRGPHAGHPVSEGTRQKLRAAVLGTKASVETRREISRANQVALKGNQNGNKLVMGTKPNGLWVCGYASVVSAANDLGIHPSNISRALKGRQQTAGGFQWAYAR